MDLRITALKVREHVRKEIEAGGFVGAKYERTLPYVTAVSYDLDGFVAKAQKALGVFEQNFACRSQLDGFGGAIEETSAIGLFELADLRANGGLRAKNFLSGT